MWSVMMCTAGYEMTANDVGRAWGTYVLSGGAYRGLIGKYEEERIF